MQLSVLFVNSALKPLLGFALPEVSSRQVLNVLTSPNPEVPMGKESGTPWGVQPAFAAFLGTEPTLPGVLHLQCYRCRVRDSRASLVFLFILLSFCTFLFCVFLISLCHCLLLGRSVFLCALYNNHRVSEQTRVRSSYLDFCSWEFP